MRLLHLDSSTQTWVMEDFPSSTVPFYAILSHTWGPNGSEVTFEDIQESPRSFSDSSKPGYAKLRFCHEKAESDDLRYFWIDTCCIKKSDSSELERSLNSMFFWYERAALCYVFLTDVSINDSTKGATFEWLEAFSRSRWFKRGWTLQELLAPASVFFFSQEGIYLGDKQTLGTTLTKVTQIPTPALQGVELSHFSHFERLSWATNRQTTMPEDSAYCMMGIFDVQLYMLYADGDYEKRKNSALNELNCAIKSSLGEADKSEDVIRIGGALWNDLRRLSQRQLWKLDADLESYRVWLLNKERQCDLPQLSRDAGERMQELLKNNGVRYEDLAGLDAGVKSWEEGWNIYKDAFASDQTRVRGLVENQRYFTRHHENIFTGITALRTLEDLMIWRGRWKN